MTDRGSVILGTLTRRSKEHLFVIGDDTVDFFNDTGSYSFIEVKENTCG